MCAIFGYISRGKSGPSIKRSRRIVNANIAPRPAQLRLRVDRLATAACAATSRPVVSPIGWQCSRWLADARMLIGHLRFATHGKPEENINNHPHPADGGWIVHNGVVATTNGSCAGCWPVSECDSESSAC
jgi:hypothetical protein